MVRETRKAKQVVTEMTCGGKMTASKIHNKPVEKALIVSSLLGCRDPKISVQLGNFAVGYRLQATGSFLAV